MTIRTSFLALMLVVAASTQAIAEDAAKTGDQPPQAEAQWTEFSAPERGFAVSFPAAPQTTSTGVAGQNPLIRYTFQANDGDDTAYSVVVLEYPAGKAPNPPEESLYVKMVQAYAKESDSKVRKRGTKTIAGRDGFEAITDDGRAKLNHLVSIVPAGDRIYMLISAGPRGHATSDDAERFRDSFRLVENVDAGQATGSVSPAP